MNLFERSHATGGNIKKHTEKACINSIFRGTVKVLLIFKKFLQIPERMQCQFLYFLYRWYQAKNKDFHKSIKKSYMIADMI